MSSRMIRMRIGMPRRICMVYIKLNSPWDSGPVNKSANPVAATFRRRKDSCYRCYVLFNDPAILRLSLKCLPLHLSYKKDSLNSSLLASPRRYVFFFLFLDIWSSAYAFKCCYGAWAVLEFLAGHNPAEVFIDCCYDCISILDFFSPD